MKYHNKTLNEKLDSGKDMDLKKHSVHVVEWIFQVENFLASSTLRISLSWHEQSPISCIPFSARYIWKKSGNPKCSSGIPNIKNRDSNKNPVRMSNYVTNLSFDFSSCGHLEGHFIHAYQCQLVCIPTQCISLPVSFILSLSHFFLRGMFLFLSIEDVTPSWIFWLHIPCRISWSACLYLTKYW